MSGEPRLDGLLEIDFADQHRRHGKTKAQADNLGEVVLAATWKVLDGIDKIIHSDDSVIILA